MLTIICRQQYFKTLLQSYETDILLTAYDYSSQFRKSYYFSMHHSNLLDNTSFENRENQFLG